MPSNRAYFSTTYTAGFIIATLPTAGFIIPCLRQGSSLFFFFPDRLCNVPQGVVLRPIWDVGTSLAGTLAGFIIATAYGRGVVFYFLFPDRLCNVPQGVVPRPIWDVGT